MRFSYPDPIQKKNEQTHSDLLWELQIRSTVLNSRVQPDTRFSYLDLIQKLANSLRSVLETKLFRSNKPCVLLDIRFSIQIRSKILANSLGSTLETKQIWFIKSCVQLDTRFSYSDPIQKKINKLPQICSRNLKFRSIKILFLAGYVIWIYGSDPISVNPFRSALKNKQI